MDEGILPGGSVAPSDAAITRCLDCVQSVSADQLRRFAKSSGVRVESVEPADLPFREQLAHVFVSGDDMEMSFKAHFMFDEVAPLVAKKFRQAPVTSGQAIDFIKEFCNLVAGRTKRALAGIGLTLGQSLPFSVQGYNEIFYPPLPKGGLLRAWRLVTAEGAVTCSAGLVVWGEPATQRLGRLTIGADDETGSIQMF